ncbi:Tyrosine-protein kinase [Trema orientale]|uniref:non-specific serine/threonine protein kinase n=1 Tax=Trema orientale TaxID=63057 RepID=A0A2P5EH57_TREOI|nr:Tyrosine-protein kinase [Trema orientale]
MSVPGSSSSSGPGGAEASGNSISQKLNSKTPFLSLKLYVVIAILCLCVFAAFLLVFLCVRANRVSRKRRNKMRVKHSSGSIPLVSKEIVEIKASDRAKSKLDSAKAEVQIGDSDLNLKKEMKAGTGDGEVRVDVHVERGKISEESDESGGSRSDASVEPQNIGWGRWYGLKELEMATRGFSEGNVIGEGGYGIVYRGVLQDRSVVAVKNLLNNKGQAEKEFKVEVEAIGKVRHKNLVGLVGYCADGPQRMLVYEYIDNGNLEQWLHGDVGPVSPLTWDIRMKIAIGTAKGYVSPEYASTGMLNEGSDVYSFGVLLMEIITGRSPIDYSRPAGEMNLVDWFKGMVANRRGEEVVDPLVEVQPPPRILKRALLVCLRCIDLDEPRAARDKDLLPPRVAASNKVPYPPEHSEIGDTSAERSRWR